MDTYEIVTSPRLISLREELEEGNLTALENFWQEIAALSMPDVFGNVLCQSGSFGWKPEGDPEQDWLARQYVASPKVPLRFYLEAGLFETDLMMVDGYAINLLASNRHLHDILQAKGYPVHYREFSGGHSTVVWRGTLADGLLALLGK